MIGQCGDSDQMSQCSDPALSVPVKPRTRWSIPQGRHSKVDNLRTRREEREPGKCRAGTIAGTVYSFTREWTDCERGRQGWLR